MLSPKTLGSITRRMTMLILLMSFGSAEAQGGQRVERLLEKKGAGESTTAAYARLNDCHGAKGRTRTHTVGCMCLYIIVGCNTHNSCLRL